MGEYEILHRLLRIAMRETSRGSPRAESVLAWCRANAGFLDLPDLSEVTGDKKPKRRRKRAAKKPKRPVAWERLLRWLGEEAVVCKTKPLPAALQTAGRLVSLLHLPPVEGRLLSVAVAVNRRRRVSALIYRLQTGGLDYGLIVSELAGVDTIDDVAKSQLVRLGLVALTQTHGGEVSLDLTDALDRVLAQAPVNDDALIASLVGTRTLPTLSLDDFVEHAERVDVVRRMLVGALQAGAAGVNILLYGPPGTGKTELAKALSAAAGASIYAVGEADEDGDEPSRWDRVTSLKLAQRVLAGRRDTVLLFDEMEDLIGEVERGEGGRHFSRRAGSKVFINRLLETNPVPTLWTSNVIDNVDTAFLRRMSFIMGIDTPPRSARVRIIGRIAASEGLGLSEAAISELADTGPEAASVARMALRTACLAGGGAADAETAMSSLVIGMRYGQRVVSERYRDKPLDLELYQSRPAIAGLVSRIAAPGAPTDFTLLLTGPPGTGKTALVHDLARRLDRPLMVKRASDIMSKWIGETERLIGEAFAQAANTGSVLLFDEVDSLLFDRSTAQRSWEVSQVNELLTRLDKHPMPFIAATNHTERLDPAAMRRFDFKLALEALPSTKAIKAFKRFFGAEAPAGLADIEGLTPGDFAVVARQIRFHRSRPDPAVILKLLAAETAAKPRRTGRIGFLLG